MPHTAARAYEQRDSVQRRSHRPRHPPKPPPQCVSYSEAASGLLTSLQGTDALANLPGSWYYSTHATDTHPRGWVRRAGNTPPCAASFFPYSFFAGEERIWPPEGDSPLAWKSLRRKNQQARKKSQVTTAVRKLQRSGKRSAHQAWTTDAVTSLFGTPYSVRLQPRRRMQGVRSKGGGPPPAFGGVFLPRFFLRYRRKNRAPGGR